MRNLLLCLCALLSAIGVAQPVPQGNPAALAPLSAPMGKDPLRDVVTIAPGRYLVTRPITIEPEPATLGGQTYFTRGWGATIIAEGVVLVVSPDFVGDRVLDIVGNHPNIRGLTIDSRWKAVDYGVVFRAKEVDGVSQASGGRGSWVGGGILGKFSVSALYFDSAEEISVRDLNLVNQGYGVGVTIANGGAFAAAWSQTMLLFDGCSFQVYGNDAIKVIGHVNDTTFADCFIATRHDAVAAAECTGRRNFLVRCRFECSSTSTIVTGATSLVFSRGNAIKNVSPLVGAFKAMEPQPRNTMPTDLIRAAA